MESLIIEELSDFSRENRKKALKRRKEALKDLAEHGENRLEIAKCQSLAPENKAYFET